ncbi:sensor histidine kinase [Paenibacillus illinoisensis]|uniref:sensor histidine kinase n=1 Tax=Paenibacillus illinoisensis TaxID=59845 RepID=UPI003017673A
MPMRILQYGLILVPAVLYLLMQPLDRDDLYTLYIIIALGLTVCKDFARSRARYVLLILAEMLWSCWLIAVYGPFMLFLSLSILYVYMYRLEGTNRWLMLGAQLIATNIALHWQYTPPQELLPWFASFPTEPKFPFLEETAGRMVGNLILVLTAALSWQGSRMASSRGQLEQVYDELRSKHYELQDARAQLLLFTKQLEGVAQEEERTRISRQLHDDIGHRLIRTKMMSEAALLTLPLDTEKGTEMVGQIRDQLAASMDDMRSTLHKLRSSSYVSEAYALDLLLEEVGRETGVKTSYEVRGSSRELYPSMQIVLYKNAKEALTNALRHGNASTITVEMEYGEREVSMSVSNDGVIKAEQSARAQPEGMQSNRSTAADSGPSGMGHEGMRLRTESIGGRLEIRQAYPYTVTTRLPMMKKADLI